MNDLDFEVEHTHLEGTASAEQNEQDATLVNSGGDCFSRKFWCSGAGKMKRQAKRSTSRFGFQKEL